MTVLKLYLLVVAVVLLAACSSTITACPPPKTYPPGFNDRLADEVEAWGSVAEIAKEARQLADDLAAKNDPLAASADAIATLLENLPDGSAVVEVVGDYIVLRDQVRACR